MSDMYEIPEQELTVTDAEIILADAGMFNAIEHQVDLAGITSGTAKIAYEPRGFAGERRYVKGADGSADYSWDLSTQASALFKVRAQRLFLEFTGVANGTALTVAAVGWR